MQTGLRLASVGLPAVSLAALAHTPFNTVGGAFAPGSAFDAPAFFGSAPGFPSLALWSFSHFHFPSLR